MKTAIWKAVSLAGTADLESPTLRNRIVLTNRLSFINLWALVGFAVVFIALGQFTLAAITIVAMAIDAMVPVLNHLKLILTARIVYIVNLSVNAFFASSMTGDYSGIYLIYYVIIFYPFIIFELQEYRSWLFTTFFVVLCFVLYQFKIRVFPDLAMLDKNSQFIIGRIMLFTPIVYTIMLMFLYKLHITDLLTGLLRNEKDRNKALEEQERTLMETQSQLRSSEINLQQRTRQMEEGQARLHELLDELQRQQVVMARQEYFERGSAELLQAARYEPDTRLEPWATRILHYLINYVGANQGAFYASTMGKDRLERIATFAVGDVTLLPATLRSGDGPSGEVIKTQQPMHLAGLGAAHTLQLAEGTVALNELYILPLVYNGQALGLIELGSLSRFDENASFFLEHLGPRLAGFLGGIILQEVRTQVLM